MMRSFFCAVTAITLFAAPVAAQSDRPRPLALINFGYQAQTQDFNQSAAFPLYGENATFEAANALEGAPIFEIGGSVGVLRNFSVGGSFVRRSTKTRDVPMAALVPSPAAPNTFRSVEATSTGHEHKERAFHVQAIWHVPVTVEFDVAVFGGPSFFNAEHDLIDTFAVSEVGPPFSQVNLTVGRTTQSESAVGFNVGIDGRYMVTRLIGGGATIRFTRGSADFTAGGEDVNIDTGGLEIGVGLRFRF